jgi:hypothetical protein
MDFLDTDEKKDRRLVHLPMGRFGEAVEQAKAALFRTSFANLQREPSLNVCLTSVASDESSYTTVRQRVLATCLLTNNMTGHGFQGRWWSDLLLCNPSRRTSSSSSPEPRVGMKYAQRKSAGSPSCTS